ncbi:MAG: DUF4038 domain-containing protein [Clostridia bacterium]|nr:DUF4038 domain-containing protein [Clostridia bacterium]
MKKFFAVLLMAAMLFTAVIMEGTTVMAEEAIKAEVWSPVEITLESTKEYANPYSDVEVDAVFTHSDGTSIKLPGFWKEKNTFAVRFSPTKTGEWSYKITSSDTSNASLNKEGKISAGATTSENKLNKHGFVRTDPEKNYFMYDDGTPFLWIADTHWQAPNCEQTNVCNYPRCNCYNQFKHIVDDRKVKGFNVYQTYFDSAENDGGGNTVVPSMWAEKYSLPSSEMFNTIVDEMFKYIYEQDMVIALGFGVHVNTPSKMTLDELKLFARYCVARYACYSIAWITGQEITRTTESATKGMSVQSVWMALAAYVTELDGYKHPNSGHMDVLPYADPKSLELDKQSWHTYWASQGGHSIGCLSSKKRYMGYVYTGKPVVEAEYNYEDINCAGFASYDLVRYGAWNALLNGCTGYTYGATGIWANCYSTEGFTGWYGALTSYSYDPWYMGLSKPGSFDVMYMHNFFNTINDWTKLKPRYSDTSYGEFLRTDRYLLSSTDDSATFVAYFMNNTSTETGTLKKLDPSKSYKAMWFNTITGKFIEVASGITGKDSYEIPERPTKTDWVFLLTSEPLREYKVEARYERPTAAADIGKLVTPYSVSAVGGMIYKGGRLEDPTKYLYDNDGVMAWEPNSDRSTQTIIYDLGAVYDVTQMNIVPAKGTVLPEYRIEGSNDGKDWTIIVHTELHEPTMSADGTYHQEPLKGQYRYIKLLLLNAENLTKDEVEKADFMLVYNEKSGGKDTPHVYSHTAISEISVFALKQSDSIVAAPTPSLNDNGAGTTPVPDGEGGGVTVKIVPIIITAVVAAVIVAAIVFIPFKKKKEQ